MDEVSLSNEAVPGAPDSGDSSSVSSWCPRELVFTAYSTPSGAAANKSPNLRVVVRRPLVARLTKDIVETYQICNPQFKYAEEQNPKRYLTSPSVGVLNDGFDNANSDLILTVNSVLANPETQRRYIVKDVLGHGTFGQVAKCWVLENRDFVAVKIIKNQPAYYQQALVEVSILRTLNMKHDPEDKHHIVRIYDYFEYRRHLCICFELLDTNLYELIKINRFRGLSLSIVQLFSKQILRGLALLKDAGIIHCDLKPENILLCTSMRPAEIKIIDFGSACMEDRTVYSYIQSRYYRSPEVLLGYQYTTAIDMWSFGCIVAELFLGLPLFPGASEFDLLQRMIKILGGQPPDYVLKEAKNATKFFKCIGNAYNPENAEASTSGRSIYQALSEEEYEVREVKKPTIGKEYFNHMNLEAIVKNYPYRKNLSKEDIIKETQIRLALIDFLHGLVEFDPAKRWSPLQASRHPFVTGEPFTCPYQPPPETPRMLVAHQNMKVSHHHPGGGHWFAAGLSPNVAVWNHQVPPGPGFQGGVPHGHPSSYGSLGSHGGSYNDSGGLATSYGSHGGDGGVMFPYYSPVGPSAMNNHLNNTAQGGQGSSAMLLGSSPDRRRRNMQFSHGGGGLGVSPSGGNFAPLPLGTSPSQFTPPSSSYNQFSAGHYGPTSPARGGSSIQGSPLGKSVAMNRRMGGWGGYSSSPQENSPSQQQQQQHYRGGHPTEGSSQAVEEVVISHHHISSNGSLGHPHSNANAMSWKQQQPAGRNGVVPAAASFNTGAANSRQSTIRLYQQQTVNEMAETNNIIPDPGDWDPNYSDDLLLQEEDGSDTGSTALAAEFAEMHFNSVESMVGGVRRLNPVAKTGSSSSSSSSSINTTSQREGSSSSYGGDQVVGKYACDQQQQQHSGYIRGPPPPLFKPPPHSLPHHHHHHHHQYYNNNNPLSRLGQQRMNHGSPSSMSWQQTADRNHTKVQHHHHHPPPPPSSSSFTSSGIHHSPGSSSLVNGISSWGGGGLRGGSDGLTSIRPTASRGRKDFGRLV